MSDIYKILTITKTELIFVVLFAVCAGIIYWIGRKVKNRDLPILAKFDEYGLWYSQVAGKNGVLLKITTSCPSTVKVVFSDTEIKHYDESEDEVDIVSESSEKKDHDFTVPASEKIRYVFIYGKYSEYLLFEELKVLQ